MARQRLECVRFIAAFPPSDRDPKRHPPGPRVRNQSGDKSTALQTLRDS